jgi:hypothetical protein
MDEASYHVIALWILHTWTYRAFRWTPYLHVSSPTKRSGKSQLLEVLAYLVAKPLVVADISAAALYRIVEKIHPTLLIDEFDQIKGADKEKYSALLGMINSGAKYDGKAIRCVTRGKEQEVVAFSSFTPKVLCGIGSITDTVADRSLPVRLNRKLATDYLEWMDVDVVQPAAESLKRRMLIWVERECDILRIARPHFPDGLNDRQRDISRPILAIADTVCGHWPETARKSLTEMFKAGVVATDEAVPIMLLSDIRDVFNDTGMEFISTTELLAKLNQIEDGQWADWNKGKGLTPHQLSRKLNAFGIYSGKPRIDGERHKGWRRPDFEEAWERYLPLPLPPSGQCDQTSQKCGDGHIRHRDRQTDGQCGHDNQCDQTRINGFSGHIPPQKEGGSGNWAEGKQIGELLQCPTCGSYHLHQFDDGRRQCQICMGWVN